MSQDSKTRVTSGIGNWNGFLESGFTVKDVLEVASEWKAQLDGVEKPWLCWNVNSDWSLVQQRQVESVGWVPIVGYDPRVGPPPLTKNAILVEFNQRFDFLVMYPHFPLEFAFAFAPKLAFWHSDLLLTSASMKKYAALFEGLQDGQLCATVETPGMLDIFKRSQRRYWELLGCTTQAASRSNFDTGCGWWLHFEKHPNCPSSAERLAREKMHWECGVGIHYWSKKYANKIVEIPERQIEDGHFTRIKNKAYVSQSPNDWRRNISKDLVANFDLVEACQKMGVSELLK